MTGSLFGTSRLGRFAYALILLAVIAFDFAKTPLETYINRAYAAVQANVVSDVSPPPLRAAGPRASPEQMALQMRTHLKAEYEKRLRAYHAHKAEFPDSDLAPPVELDKDVALEWVARQPGVGLQAAESQIAQSAAFTGKMTAANSSHAIAIGLLGLLSLVVIAWAVLARLRDIGWAAWVGYAILGIFLIKTWTMQAVPQVVAGSLHVVFLALLLVLAFIPAEFDLRRKTVASEVRPAVPRGGSNRPTARGQFGQRRH